MSKEDVLLRVMENKADLDLLYGLWTIAQNAPSKCAEILLNYKDVCRGAERAIDSMTAVQDGLSRLSGKREEIESLITQTIKWRESVKMIDEEVFFNRLNRLCELAERVEKLKKSGALNTLKALLESK